MHSPYPAMALWIQMEVAPVAGGSEEAEEGSPKGKGQQFPDEDQGYNPLVPGRVVYIHRSVMPPLPSTPAWSLPRFFVLANMSHCCKALVQGIGATVTTLRTLF